MRKYKSISKLVLLLEIIICIIDIILCKSLPSIFYIWIFEISVIFLYMYEKSLLDESFKNKWNMLICILSIVLQEQSFDIIRENGRLYLKVYQRSKDYELLNKQYKALQDKIIEEYSESKKIDDIIPNFYQKKQEEQLNEARELLRLMGMPFKGMNLNK